MKKGYIVLSVSIRGEIFKKYKVWCEKNATKMNRKTEILIENFLEGEKGA